MILQHIVDCQCVNEKIQYMVFFLKIATTILIIVHPQSHPGEIGGSFHRAVKDTKEIKIYQYT